MRKFRKYDIVRHFKYETLSESDQKSGLYMYQILEPIAVHTETNELLIIYKSLHNGQVFARPLKMFASPVDKAKYPDIMQEYRFELVKHCDKEVNYHRLKSVACSSQT